MVRQSKAIDALNQNSDRLARPTGGLGVAFGLAFGPGVAIGLARFAYALLLPNMKHALHWSFAVAGAMNTANAVGYLAGALATAIVANRVGINRSFLVSTAIVVLSLFATAASANMVILLLLRFIAGTSGAVSFIAGAGLAAQWGRSVSPGRASLLLGVYFSGGGLGIVISGLLVPVLLSLGGPANGWRIGWLALGLLGALSFVFLAKAASRCRMMETTLPSSSQRPSFSNILPTLVAYALFGAGYIAYMTFIVAFLVHYGATTLEITLFWTTLGMAGFAFAFAWGPLLGRLRSGRGIGLVLGVLSVGASLPLLSHLPVAAFSSAVLFGASFLAVVTAVTTVARRSLPPDHWTAGIAALTVAFALGQCIGPVLAGILSDTSGGIRLGLGLSAGLLVLALFVGLAQRHHGYERPLVNTQQSL